MIIPVFVFNFIIKSYNYPGKVYMNQIYLSNKTNPMYNLAVEEYLLNTVSSNQSILFLWQNENTVVIGKHQNPWIECKLTAIKEDHVTLVRRITGGGAVFHDLGNLNFSFIMPLEKYNLQKQLEIIVKAVQSLGIPAYFEGRNDILVDHRKFSGNAFCKIPHAKLHHGTILISSQLDRLSHYLDVPIEKIQSKGVASVRSRVCNLNEYNKEITIEQMKQKLSDLFQDTYGQATIQPLPDNKLIESYWNKQNSIEWIYGETPPFNWELKTHFSWGMMHFQFQVNNGHLIHTTIFSDAMNPQFIETLQSILQNIEITQMSTILLQQNFIEKSMIQDLVEWFHSKGL